MRNQLVNMAAVATLFALNGFAAGHYYGMADAPLDSERATIQVASGDVQARWIGYGCGDDGATVIARDMPSLTECKEVRLASESASFDMPSRR